MSTRLEKIGEDRDWEMRCPREEGKGRKKCLTGKGGIERLRSQLGLGRQRPSGVRCCSFPTFACITCSMIPSLEESVLDQQGGSVRSWGAWSDVLSLLFFQSYSGSFEGFCGVVGNTSGPGKVSTIPPLPRHHLCPFIHGSGL